MSNNLSRHTLGLTELQSGQGAPSHQSNKGSFYIDVLTSNFYKNTDGSTSWQILVTTGSTDNYVTGGIFTGTTLTLYQQNKAFFYLCAKEEYNIFVRYHK